MIKYKTFLLTLIFSTLLITNVEAKYLFENEVNKIPSDQISINSQNPKYSNETEELLNISDNSYYDSSEESFEDIVYGIFGLLVFVVLPLYWKPSRKAIGLMNINFTNRNRSSIRNPNDYLWGCPVFYLI